MTDPSPAMSVRGLTKGYRRDAPVLAGLDWSVPRGSVTGLIGANGAGKTTLLDCLLGLLGRDAGEVQVLGLPLERMDDAVRGRLGHVPQQAALLPWLTVGDLIAHTGVFYPTWDQALASDLASRWKLPLAAKAGTLSGGQAQVLAILLALAHRPELVILDEPASALDPAARRTFLQAVLEVVGRGGTVVFSTHLTADLERVADRIAVLAGGRIRFSGGLDDLQTRTRRLRITAPSGSAKRPERRGLEGVLSWEDKPEGAVAVVHGEPEREAGRLRAAGFGVEADPLPLEDIAVEMQR